jgi:hypothetical protein
MPRHVFGEFVIRASYSKGEGRVMAGPLIQQDQAPWVKAKGCSNKVFILGDKFFPITILIAQIERMMRWKAHPTLTSEKSMPDPFKFYQLRDFEIGKVVLCFQSSSI